MNFLKEAQMFTRKLLYTVSGVVLLGVLATSSAGAQFDSKRTTYFTFSKAVQLPGVSLAAGTYIFEVPEPNDAWYVVRVSSRDRSRVYLTAFTRLTERPMNENLEPAIVLGEASASNPPRIKAWYPQGERTGRQFLY
jgi:hypothetical protein